MTYERALEIIQTEEYLTAADIDLIHKRADINSINKRKKRSMTSSSKDAKDKVTKTASTNLFFFSHVFFISSILLTSSKQPNLRIPNPQYFVYLLDQQ